MAPSVSAPLCARVRRVSCLLLLEEASWFRARGRGGRRVRRARQPERGAAARGQREPVRDGYATVTRRLAAIAMVRDGSGGDGSGRTACPTRGCRGGLCRCGVHWRDPCAKGVDDPDRHCGCWRCSRAARASSAAARTRSPKRTPATAPCVVLGARLANGSGGGGGGVATDAAASAALLLPVLPALLEWMASAYEEQQAPS